MKASRKAGVLVGGYFLIVGALLALVVLVSCATMPRQPSVVTRYAGQAVLRSAFGINHYCPASIDVTQSGSNLVLGSMRLGGRCFGLEIPGGRGQLGNGADQFWVGSVVADPQCGTYFVRIEGTFEDSEHAYLMLDYQYEENTCYAVGLTVDLQRVAP